MKNLSILAKCNKGFTLIELSIVLVIVGIMMYGATQLYSYASEKARIDATNNTLDAIEDALKLYFKTNSTLPCPAVGNRSLTDNTFGKADCTSITFYGNMARSGGVIPTRSLDLPDSYMFDAWGNRITYYVSTGCYNSPGTWDTTCASRTELGYVYDNTDNTTGTDANDLRTQRAVYVVLSLGKNGIGAYRRNGGISRIPRTANTTVAEMQNAKVSTTGGIDFFYANGNFRDDFIRDWKGTETGSGVAGQDGTYFDDIVRWKTPEQLSYQD